MEKEIAQKYKVKFLKTSYKRCVPARLEKLQQEYDLIVRSVKMPQKKTDDFG